MPVLLLFLAIPLVEIALFVVIGGAMGLWLTLAAVLASAVLGVLVMRIGARSSRPSPRNPMAEVVGRGFSMLAGILLIIPGFLTSALGVLLLVPPIQALMIYLLGQRLTTMQFVFRQGTARPDDIIDGDFEEVSKPVGQSLPPSKWTQG